MYTTNLLGFIRTDYSFVLIQNRINYLPKHFPLTTAQRQRLYINSNKSLWPCNNLSLLWLPLPVC